MAALDIHMLGRDGAEADWPEEVRARARAWFDAASPSEQDELMAAVMAGLPGALTATTSLASASHWSGGPARTGPRSGPPSRGFWPKWCQRLRISVFVFACIRMTRRATFWVCLVVW
jgi:hypothetical protein